MTNTKLIIFGISMLLIGSILSIVYLQDDAPDVQIKEQSTTHEKTTVDPSTMEKKLEKSDFDIKKDRLLNHLIQLGFSNSFTISFDADKSSDGNKFHVYKINHDKDGWIGDLTFYSGSPDSLWHPSKFNNIFQMTVYLSNENGVSPTTASKPIVKEILKKFDTQLISLGLSETSKWIENIIISGTVVEENGEREETTVVPYGTLINTSNST